MLHFTMCSDVQETVLYVILVKKKKESFHEFFVVLEKNMLI